MKEQQAVSALQDAFKENGIETRKLPRAAALRVSFMGSFHRVVYAGEGKGWLVTGYNEDGDPAKISELRSLCEELSEEANNSEPSDQNDLASITTPSPVADAAAPNPEPAQADELRQLQSAIAGIEGTTYCNKAPRQKALLFDFHDEQYRVDFEENCWVVGLVFGSGQHLEHLQQLIPNLLATEEDAIATPESSPLSAEFLCTAINDNCVPQGLKAEKITETLIKVTIQEGAEVLISRLPTAPTDWFLVKIERPWYWGDSPEEETLRKALERLLPMIREVAEGGSESEDAIASPGEEIETDVIANSELINQILHLSSQLGAEAVVSEEGVCRELTSLALPNCSISELSFILGRLTELSQFVGTDDSETIPDEQLSADERAANAYGAQVVKSFLSGEAIADSPGDSSIPGIKVGQWTMLRTQEGEEAITPNPESVKRRHYLKWIHKLANLSNVAILPHEAEFLRDPEECPLADLKKIIDRLLSFPNAIASAEDDDWRSQDLTDEEREIVDREYQAGCQRQGEHYNRMMRCYHEMRSRQDDDHGEPINYRPAAEVTR